MMKKKVLMDLDVVSSDRLNDRYVLLKLTSTVDLPPMEPGQFVEVRIDHTPETMLRRPISIHFVDEARNELWLLVAAVGAGTRRLAALQPGQQLNCVLPLGRGFTVPETPSCQPLLVGGGVGVAPLLYLGKRLSEKGITPTFLLGARTGDDLLELEHFRHYGAVYVTTEDGSMGEKGFVTDHSILQQRTFDQIATCGPKPMMVSVARYAAKAGISCEASLENLMACGLGACLCCVEKTTEGHLCVCTEGPVFDTRRLLW